MNESTDKTKLPVVSCPQCTSNCYPIEINMCCEKCAEIYPLDTSLFAGNVQLSKADTELVRQYIKTLLKKQKVFEKYGKIVSQEVGDFDKVKSFSVIYKNEMLTILQKLKKEYGFKGLTEVVKFITHSFLYILKTMKTLPGNSIYLVDELNNRSDDIKTGFLKETYNAFNREQDKLVVESFAKNMGIRFRVDALKNQMGEINE